MQPQFALARLKTRVDPTIPADIRYHLKSNAEIVVRVAARISENGDVTVLKTSEGNPLVNTSVKNAVEQWKFTPARDTNGPRCVNTEFPIVIKRVP
jgi:hypothetical protein